jgi:hypothetical protein
LAIAGSGQVFLFHVLTGQELFALGEHHTSLPQINFTEDGQTLITGIAPDPGAGKDVYELIKWHAPRDGVPTETPAELRPP